MNAVMRWLASFYRPHESRNFPGKDPPQAVKERVKSIAELLWESAGRPEGTADEDWRLAEEIVKRAATAA